MYNIYIYMYNIYLHTEKSYIIAHWLQFFKYNEEMSTAIHTMFFQLKFKYSVDK